MLRSHLEKTFDLDTLVRRGILLFWTRIVFSYYLFLLMIKASIIINFKYINNTLFLFIYI